MGENSIYVPSYSFFSGDYAGFIDESGNIKDENGIAQAFLDGDRDVEAPIRFMPRRRIAELREDGIYASGFSLHAK